MDFDLAINLKGPDVLYDPLGSTIAYVDNSGNRVEWNGAVRSDVDPGAQNPTQHDCCQKFEHEITPDGKLELIRDATSKAIVTINHAPQKNNKQNDNIKGRCYRKNIIINCIAK